MNIILTISIMLLLCNEFLFSWLIIDCWINTFEYFFLVNLLQTKLTNEKRLLKFLHDNYPVKLGRPINDTDNTFFVNFAITLIQILELVWFLFEIHTELSLVLYFFQGCKQTSFDYKYLEQLCKYFLKRFYKN